jgi:hypothetical protein
LTQLGAAERYDDDHLEEVGRRLLRRGLACSWRAVCNRKLKKQDSGIAVSKEEVLTSFSGRIQLPAKASQRPLFGTEWHCALINSCRQDPCFYLPGNIIFARCATRSDAARGCVGKLEYAFTGPWHVTASLHGGSYLLKHCHNAACKEKKHAADLAPYPPEMIPFEPVYGVDTYYGQLYKPIGEHLFKESGIKGFTPPSPFQVPANFLDIGDFKDFCWPTLAELINNIEPFPWRDEEEHQMVMTNNNPISLPVMYIGPPPLLPIASKPEPLAPTVATLAPLIISSTDKLFFIAHMIGTADCYEWRLVRVAFQDSVSLYPSCLQDGRFLVKFYMAHLADACYNSINQQFWL